MSTLCLISSRNGVRINQSSSTPTSSVTCPGKRGNAPFSPRSTYIRSLCLQEQIASGLGEQKTRREKRNRTRRDTLLRPIHSTGEDPCLAINIMRVSYIGGMYIIPYHRARPRNSWERNKKKKDVTRSSQIPQTRSFFLLWVLRCDGSGL